MLKLALATAKMNNAQSATSLKLMEIFSRAMPELFSNEAVVKYGMWSGQHKKFKGIATLCRF